MAANGAVSQHDPGGTSDGVDVPDRVSFAASMAAAPSDERLGAQVLSDVLSFERRPSRVAPLLDAWADRFSGAVRRGDHAAAGHWIRVVTDRPNWDEYLRGVADDALDRMTTRELVETLVLDLANRPGSSAGADLLGAWGRRLVPTFVDWIVVDDPPVSRKHIVDHLAAIGRSDLEALLPYLADERWFIVRNFATAVGRSSDPDAVEPLLACLGHSDDRVRLEALRGIAAIKRDAAVMTLVEALGDESEAVRQAAVSLLRAVGSDDIVPILEQVIDDKKIDASDARRLVGVIAERPAAVSRPVLERLAARRPAFGAHKAAREAARTELETRRS